MAHQLHAKLVGFVLWMRARWQGEAAPPVWDELLLLQLGVQATRECHLYIYIYNYKNKVMVCIKEVNRFFLPRQLQSWIFKCVYRGKDERIRRKTLEASTRLQIYWISQVERRHCRSDQVWSLCQHCGNTSWYETVGTMEVSFDLLWVPVESTE